MDESKIRELLDREQIREAFNRYAFGVDSSDAEAVLSVFDDPCTLIAQQPGKPPRRYEGRAAVERFFNKAVNNDMKLLRQRTPVFALTWTVLHPIDEASPRIVL